MKVETRQFRHKSQVLLIAETEAEQQALDKTGKPGDQVLATLGLPICEGHGELRIPFTPEAHEAALALDENAPAETEGLDCAALGADATDVVGVEAAGRAGVGRPGGGGARSRRGGALHSINRPPFWMALVSRHCLLITLQTRTNTPVVLGAAT